jgi:AGZA family xanthine/uracil permease-like MFS transporter
LGTTTSGVYIESAAGIEEGGRTGFTAIIVALLFGLSLFCAPVLTVVPAHAYGTALIVIGILMISPIARIDFSDYTELIPAFLTIVLTCFTYNIGVGVTAGLLTHPLLKLLSGRVREVAAPQWVLAALSSAFYLFYPYSHG